MGRSRDEDRDRDWKRRLIPAAAIAATALIAYSNTFQVPFVFDDTRNIVENPFVRITSLGELGRAALGGPWGRPLAFASFGLNHYLGGYETTGYHVVNVAIHVANGVLVYLLALFFFGSRERADAMALLTALVFIAHPVQTQSVTYVVQRMTGLAALFSLVTLLLFIRGRREAGIARRAAFWGAAGATWLLALASKETAAALPFVVLLIEWVFFRRSSWRWLRQNLVYAVGALVLVTLLGTIYLDGRPVEGLLQGYERREFTPWERVLTEWRVVVFYLSLLFLPLPGRMNLLHAFPLSRSLFDPVTTLLSLLALLGLAALAFALLGRRPVAGFGILWFFILLALESSLVPLEIVFEHRLYLPMLGVALGVTDLLFWSPGRTQRAVVAGSLIVLALAAATWARNETWRDPLRLWSDVVRKNPASDRAQEGLATVLVERGRIEEAVRHYLEAIRLNPDFAEAHNNLGITFARARRANEAIHHLSEAVRISPAYARAHYNLGVALAQRGRRDEAIHHLSEAVRLLPSYEAARGLLDRISRGESPSSGDDPPIPSRGSGDRG